ncbi:hypothetical protein BDZ88DRAFT_413357 [Geranomyces variabilis]|nr:hypothetical protein BDZ88DRAFT_413357 [Geranomyces variabilis]KAJ3134814.1 hypothetical protein HDU90_004845 [Geranomyces variabilis]
MIDGQEHHHHHHALSPQSLSIFPGHHHNHIPPAAVAYEIPSAELNTAEGGGSFQDFAFTNPFNHTAVQDEPVGFGAPPPGSPPASSSTSFTPLASGAPTPGNATPVGAQSPPPPAAKTPHTQHATTATTTKLHSHAQKPNTKIPQVQAPPPPTIAPTPAIPPPTNAQIHESNRKRLAILRDVFMSDPEGHRQACRELKDWCNDRRAYVAEIAADLDLTLRAATEKGVAPPYDAGIALEVMHVVERQKRFMSALAAGKKKPPTPTHVVLKEGQISDPGDFCSSENCAVYTKVLTEYIRQQHIQQKTLAAAMSAAAARVATNDKAGAPTSVLEAPSSSRPLRGGARTTPPPQMVWTGANNPVHSTAKAATRVVGGGDEHSRQQQQQQQQRRAASPFSMSDFFSTSSAPPPSTTTVATTTTRAMNPTPSFTGYLTSPTLLSEWPSWAMPTSQPFSTDGGEASQDETDPDQPPSQSSTMPDDATMTMMMMMDQDHGVSNSPTMMDFAALVDEDEDGFKGDDERREESKRRDGRGAEDTEGGLMEKGLEHMDCDWN